MRAVGIGAAVVVAAGVAWFMSPAKQKELNELELAVRKATFSRLRVISNEKWVSFHFSVSTSTMFPSPPSFLLFIN